MEYAPLGGCKISATTRNDLFKKKLRYEKHKKWVRCTVGFLEAS